MHKCEFKVSFVHRIAHFGAPVKGMDKAPLLWYNVDVFHNCILVEPFHNLVYASKYGKSTPLQVGESCV